MTSTERPGSRVSAWRRWLPPLRRTLLALWLPAILPFLFGPLRECQHCVRTYLAFLPILPGLPAGVLFRLEDVWFAVAAGAATLSAVAVVAVLMRESGRHWRLVATVVAALSGIQALALGSLLRM